MNCGVLRRFGYVYESRIEGEGVRGMNEMDQLGEHVLERDVSK